MQRPVLLFALVSLLLSLTFTPSRSSARQLSSTKGSAAAALEQEVLREINLVRTRPAEYAAYLEQLRPYFKGKEYTRPGMPGLLTQEGSQALEEAISALRAAKPAPALTASQGMRSGALLLVKDQMGTDTTGHKGRDGSFCEQRTQRFGAWQEPIGENLSYGSDTARERVLTLLIDDGFANRAHRKRLLDASFRVAGIACGDHKMGAMCVITLAGGFTDGPSKMALPAKTLAPVPSGARKF
ncbi:MAG TPA: CAP domain-containing protein [Pyrinomonadaceae bacterium]|nr:CAP domain-containing protein [Pyrinomonadaceae bacterium]